MSAPAPSVRECCPPGSTVPRSRSAAAKADDQPTRDLGAFLQRRSDLIRPRVLAADGVGESAAHDVEEVRADEQRAADPEQAARGRLDLTRLPEQEREQYGEGRREHQCRAVERERAAERPAACARDHEQSDEERCDGSAARVSPAAALEARDNPREREGHSCRGQPRDHARVRVGVQRAEVEVVELEVDELSSDLG